MTNSIDPLTLSADYVNRFALALVRVLAALSLNPLLGSARVPMPGRIGLGVVLTLVLFPPGAPAGAPVTFGPLEVAGELLVGLLAGFVVALGFAAVQFAASLVGIGSGLNVAATLDPNADLGTGALEQFFSALALVVFVQINGHHLFINGLNDLFQAVGVGTVPQVALTVDKLITITTALFAAAIKMVLPVVAALLLADLGLAILARVAPQLNLFTLGLPAKLAIGLAMLIVAMPWVLPRMAAIFRVIPDGMLALGG
jgi:flagellar biosynthetic protein FliR